MSTYKAIIIGSGFGGQCAAINLQQSGFDDFLIVERRSFMGGTWCQNTYPGAAVDVQSPLYSMSFEPYDWSQMLADQDELHDYTLHVIEKYQLREKTLLNANVNMIRWNESRQYWEVHLEGMETRYAQFVINASGPLSTPVIPDFPGRDSFKGAAFHTNNWDHSVSLHDKRVAIIGSGASAAQVIPAIVEDVEHLHVFQRTPHWVVPRHDYVFSPWQRALLRRKPFYALLRQCIYWYLETRVIGFKYSDKLLQRFGQQMALKHLENQVTDLELRKKLTPDFTIGCKRVILSDTLYPAFCRQNVSLHSKEQSISKITENGIDTVDGQSIALDAIVYSTGYDATDGAISYPVIGRDGQTLGDFWQEFPRAYLGTAAPGFPNLFIVTGPNTGIGHTSALFIIEAQMHYIIRSLKEVQQRQKSSITVKPEAEDKYTRHIHQEMEKTVWKSGGCNSWYQSKSGHVIAMFPGFSFTYLRWTKHFREVDHEFA